MIGPWQLLIVLVIVVLLFGTKRLRNLGPDLGNAIRGFRNAVKDGEAESHAGENEADKLTSKTEQGLNSSVIENEKDRT